MNIVCIQWTIVKCPLELLIQGWPTIHLPELSESDVITICNTTHVLQRMVVIPHPNASKRYTLTFVQEAGLWPTTPNYLNWIRLRSCVQYFSEEENQILQAAFAMGLLPGSYPG